MSSPFYDPFNGNGRIIHRTINSVVWAHELPNGSFELCEQQYIQPILENNQEAYAENHGKRWGDGKIVASPPLRWWFEHILPAKLNGDDAYIKRIYNDIDYRKFRRFPGKI